MISAAPRRAAHPAPTRDRAPLVLVTGGKGGVGKTILAANLALAVAARGRSVLLADLDLGLADLDVVLGLDRGRELGAFLDGSAALEQCVARTALGVDLLSAGTGDLDLAALDAGRREHLVGGLRGLAAGYDLVVADGAAGVGPDAVAFAAEADHVLLVTTPDAAALTDAYGMVKALHLFGERAGREVPTPELVVNQAGSLDDAERVAARLRTTCERFLARSPRSAGWLPQAADVARSARTRRPFVLESSSGLAATCLRQIAARVDRLSRGSQDRERDSRR